MSDSLGMLFNKRKGRKRQSEKMAAHSGAADWSSVIKPLLNNRTGVLNKNDITNIIKAILKNENEFFDEEGNYIQFYTAFAALAADKLSQCKFLCQTQVPQMYDACLVLIRFILSRLSKVDVQEIKWLLPALKSLCEGKSLAIAPKPAATAITTDATAAASGTTVTPAPTSTNTVLQFDYNLVAAQLRSSKYPDSGKSVVGSDKESPKSESKRSRSDLSSVIIAQLTAPLEPGKFTWTPLSEELADCSELFASSSMSYLQSLDAADTVLDMCMSLPILSRYGMRYEDTVITLGNKQLYFPLTPAEAAQVRSQAPQIVIDIGILWHALTLPIMESLSPQRIEKLSKCAIAALYCAILTSISSSVCNMSSSVSVQKSVATSNSTAAAGTAKDADETEEQARFIVDKALEIYTIVGNLLKTSTRVHIYQNHLCFGAWLLISGIQGALGASGSSNNSATAKQAATTATTTATTDETAVKSKSSTAINRTVETSTNVVASTARVNLFKVQQGFGVLNAAIANHCIKLLVELIDDLKIESTSYATDVETLQQMPEPAGFNVLETYTSLQRVVRVLNTGTLHQSFTFLATAAYRKACALKRASTKDRIENEPISYSDSTTYFNDTLSCSDHSEEDDSEGYLGHWFKETLSPEAADDVAGAGAQAQAANAADDEKSNLMSTLDEPHEYLDLAAQIFCFLDKFFGNKHFYLHRYIKAGLTDQQMLLIANLLKDLDRDVVRSETDPSACPRWQLAMVHFSGAVGRYLHNLISAGLLNESLQSSLLQYLSVSPWSTESNSWPLQVYPSTLSVLVQILLLKPMQEKEAACLSVWHRLINTLVEGVCATSATTVPMDADYEDLNIEHAQLLLFLFHSLNLMQKKCILLLTAGGVIRCAEICRSIGPERVVRNSQIMLLTRLLLLLEYLMKHLYNAPAELLDQVRWNLFSTSTLQENQKLAELMQNKSKFMGFCRKDIEDRFRKSAAEYTSNIRPTFYSLTSIDGSTSQTEFKLDGLAWNFILSTPDKLKYPLLIDALNDILSIADLSEHKVNVHTLCAIQYCFSVGWKLLLGMPPPTTHIESLMEDRALSLIPLMWGIRSPTSFTQQLICQSLIKQGMYTQLADKFWYSLTDRVMDLRYSLKQTYLSVKNFNNCVDKSQPRLSQIILLDAITSHMFAAAWADQHNIKQIRCTPPSTNASCSAAAATTTTTTSTTASTTVALESELMGIVSKSSESDDVAIKSQERAQSTEELLSALIASYVIVAKTLRNRMAQQLSDSVPRHILELILPFVSSKNPITTELSGIFLKMLPDHDVELITTEWPKCLINFETVCNSKVFVVEEFTLSVIEAHIDELTKQSNYTQLNSLKHCLLNILNTLELLLPSNVAANASMAEVCDALKQLCVVNKLDLRFEFTYEISDKCLKTLFNEINCADGSEEQRKASDAQLLLSYECSIKYCYALLLELCEELRQQTSTSDRNFCESMLFAVLKTLMQMTDKAVALQSMQRFFKQRHEGSLVELMLCFTGTNMSMLFAKKVLQFIEKLFTIAEAKSSQLAYGFPLEQLHECFYELGNVDEVRIKNWLSHVIYGPNGIRSSVTGGIGISMDVTDKNAASSSTPSSNAQTPTNMATVSAMPSLSDQLAQSSVALEAEAMEIDDDAAAAAAVVVSATSAAAAAATSASNNAAANTTSLAIWQTAGNSYLTNQSEDCCSQLDNNQQTERNGAVLLSVVKHIVRDAKAAKCIHAVLYQSLQHLGSCLITPPQQESADFSDILQVLVTLADTGQNRGHESLFTAITVWLDVTKFYVADRASGGKNVNVAVPQSMLETINALLKYLSELLQSLGYKGSKHLNPPWDDDIQNDFEELLIDDAANGDEDDSLLDDSDEDSLNNKLCTFSQTQKEFMSQHWYHCHTCNMVSTVGVCSVCARVCHKGHDVSYAKYGNFFCDCGAKEDNSCQALSRRTSTHPLAAGSSAMPGSSRDAEYMQNYAGGNSNILALKKRNHGAAVAATATAVVGRADALNERIALLSKLIEASRETLQNTEQWSNVVRCILEFFEVLLPNMRENASMYSIVGCHERARNALQRLHQSEQLFEMSDQLMVPTLGSQEGAFENVRMNYSGDQGQTIKQLLSSGLVRRVALCCLSSPHGKRQHLAVSHEKGKVTILQLSALLKQADAAKRKLTLTQLSSAPVPCTVLSLTANPANEDCLAVCGLKECHILTFTNTGATSVHIVLTPQLENGNFIKKALWLPGSQTLLALVTADYVKIYELAEDAYSPKYYFLVAVGKIRDCTFLYQNNVGYYMLLIASSGYIYYQKLDDQSLAKHGDFYVTNTLDLNHQQIKDVNGQVGGGGVSIYYSHTLQLLFFSYSIGRNFMAALQDINKGVMSITQWQTMPAVKNSSKGPEQPLCQWTEITGHPGLICAMMQTSNNPVVFMLQPDRIVMQEIKAQSSKSRIMDMVPIRHTVGGIEKTTLILLCEDGSLRIFTAQPEHTSYWLSPQVQPFGNQLYSNSLLAKTASSSKKNKRKLQQKSGAAAAGGGSGNSGGNNNTNFPIDFFEHCNMLTDVEFGGNDLLQIYNRQKLKTRLFSTGMFVASTRPNGFTLEIYNNDPNNVMVGIRLLLGTQEPLRAPTTVTVLGRSIPTLVHRARWFDIPLTRDEIMQSDKCLKVVFGKSQDPENVCMLDCIEVYGKSKDLLGWTDDSDENTTGTAASTSAVASAGVASNAGNGNGIANATSSCGSVATINCSNMPMVNFGEGFNCITSLDRLVTNLLEVLDYTLNLLGSNNVAPAMKQKATTLATVLLLLPTPNPVQIHARYVLATLFGNRLNYHAFKDNEVLSYVHGTLEIMRPKLGNVETMLQIDPEGFYRLVLMVRSIANSRPSSLTKICLENNFNIVQLMMLFVTELHKITPSIDEPVSIVRRGLCHTETIVQALVEIWHAFVFAEPEQLPKMTALLIELLKHDSSIISHSAKEACILLLSPRNKRKKMVAIVTPPTCATPTPANVAAPAAAVAAAGAAADEVLEAAAVAAAGNNQSAAAAAAAVARSNSVEFGDAIINAMDAAADHQMLNLEAFMGGGFPQLLNLQQDADDETIMDIAIALSLQQHDGEAVGGANAAAALQQDLANLQSLRQAVANNAASVSAGGSDDDEVSNVATDGSTLRTSPAEPAEGAGSGGSESGGSCIESIGGISGRSSTYGDPANASPPRSVATHSDKSNITTAMSVDTPTTSASARAVALANAMSAENEENESEDELHTKLHDLRLSILENIIEFIPTTFYNCNGVQAIPLMQVILVLTTDLNGNNERDQKALHNLLLVLVEFIEMSSVPNIMKMKERNAKHEINLALLCLFGVLMGKTKSKQAGTTSPPHQFKDNASFVACSTAAVLTNNGSFNFCLLVLESMLSHWKMLAQDQSSAGANANTAAAAAIAAQAASPNATGSTAAAGSANASSNSTTNATQNVLKPMRHGPKPDVSTLIPHNYLKSYPDIFESYDALLTEITVRLPYQILRLSSQLTSADWYVGYSENLCYILCEYMMLNLNPLLRRQVRKLLMYLCGNKEKFRMYRDGHSLNVHFNVAKKICNLHNTKNVVLSNQSVPLLNYDSLVELTEHLRTCQEVSQVRTGNWQKFCLTYEDVLPVLMEIACYQLDDGVSPIILQLLQAALCSGTPTVVKQQTAQQSSNAAATTQSLPSSSSKARNDRDKSEETDNLESKFDAAHCPTFVNTLFRYVSDALLNKFVRIFLLETNITSIRWQAHSLIFAIYEHASERQKEKLIEILWNMWPLMPAFGRRTAQFVDILGYLTLSTKSIEAKLPYYTERAVEVLRQQNDQLAQHPNSPIYSVLEQVLQVNGYYLESEPCLVCNNPEVPMTNIKLPAIKSDSKFTTTTMIVKLVQSHTISKLIVRIADLKRTKMVRTINIHYNNRTVQAVVELKNRPALWHKARSVTLQSGQTEVKIDFPLPITACNLMIEYADFFETVTGSSENLQCPRCSAAVPAYPGVCANCGENVFQCHKCRAINYDEKDPFLCHSCGFCKYAKFDFSIYGRVCCAVDPIESAEDRAKTVQIIHSSLERADRIYRQLQALRTMLEVLVQKVSEQHYSDRLVEDNMGTVHITSQVSKLIQLLAQKYCVESRSSFEELSKIVQKVKACRSELVAYDRSQENPSNSHVPDTRENCGINRCYGCALASTEQCLTLLRAIASNYSCRMNLYAQGLVEELAQHNLRSGTLQIQEEVRQLLVLLTKGNKEACMQLLELISDRVKAALMGAVPLVNLDAVVHHEMILLEVLIAQDDFCWEQKLKVVFELFVISSRNPRGGTVAVVQPCLRIIQMLIYTNATTLTNKTYREMPPALSSIDTIGGLTVQFNKWLQGHPEHSYESWRARMPTNNTITASAAQSAANLSSIDDGRMLAVLQTLRQQNCMDTSGNDKTMRESDVINETRQQVRETFLGEKYARRWRLYVLNKKCLNAPLELNATWLQPLLFNPNSRAGRSAVCSLLSALSRTFERRVEILNLLTCFLKFVGEVGECSTEFLALYRSLAAEAPWYHYLTLRGLLTEISDLMTVEIKKIHNLEETTLSSDLSQGFALRQLVELLAMFLSKPKIRQVYKTRLLGPVLEGYLSLRKLVVQRTRLIDDAQEKLLEMLEEMTTGTEEETRAFMEILIDTVEKTNLHDIKTPVFIFERLYSIIHPEENDESEFFMTLEKDPQQEDFLQGRMLGNPYSSTEAGLGPLMRDVKNKICTDCELIALLEDDNGMELLVNNKIISLDLPVKEVYKKIWLAEGGERDAMRIVYRMRGLLGDATEEFIERLSNKSQEEVDTEQLYRMANVLADCNGLKVMLDRIGSLQNITRTRELIQVLLKLFLISVKVRRCQEVLCQPELGAINTLLKVLQMCLQSEPDSIQSAVTEQLLDIMETILSKAASESLDSFLQFSLTFGGPEYVTALISCTNCANVRNNPSVLRHLIRVLAALVYGNEMKMALLCEHFKDILDFNRFDVERLPEEEFKMELFCVLTNQIEHNCIGGTLKDYIVSMGILEHAIDYITKHAPCVKPTLLRTDSDELKEFISRPSLKYILRFLTGLANKHEATQLAISKDIIPIIHRLEQVSSDEHVGSLAENLLEALCTDQITAQRVQEVRDFTRAEKKRLAMATREKQLDALGMRTNEKGQVTAKGSILQKIEKLRDETGLTCFICREGYSCQPAKVLGIYTFTKRCNVEEFELKTRKTLGYTTVTHFNVVHVDCHTSAIRLARGRDEWERASLQNANTRCNGLLPLWGPEVLEAAFSACMTRHSGYMQESTQRVDISFPSSMHDLKLLLMRFAWERSFHDDAGGGGPQSNMHFTPYLLFYSVYLLLSSRSAARDSKNLMSYLTAAPTEKWLECAYEVEGPLYMITISLALHSTEIWNKHKVAHLKRLLTIAQVRHVSPSVQCKALLSTADRETKDYGIYRPFLLMWALIDLIYNTLFNTVSTSKEEDWSISLFDYIRKNDEAMLKATDTVLQTFTEEFLPCASFGEFCDVAGLLHLIENPDGFIADILSSLPSSPPTSAAT